MVELWLSFGSWVVLPVTSRKVVWLFSEQLRLEFVPVFHRLQGRLAAEGRLWKLLVVEPDSALGTADIVRAA